MTLIYAAHVLGLFVSDMNIQLDFGQRKIRMQDMALG